MNDYENKRAVTIAYIDFSRAFNSVSHDKLFFIFNEYGIRGQLLGSLKNCWLVVHTKPELALHCRVLL